MDDMQRAWASAVDDTQRAWASAVDDTQRPWASAVDDTQPAWASAVDDTRCAGPDMDSNGSPHAARDALFERLGEPGDRLCLRPVGWHGRDDEAVPGAIDAGLVAKRALLDQLEPAASSKATIRLFTGGVESMPNLSGSPPALSDARIERIKDGFDSSPSQVKASNATTVFAASSALLSKASSTTA